MKEPWFKFWAADFLTDSDVDRIPPEAEGLLVRMWCICRIDGCIPADHEEIARLTRRKVSYVSYYVSYCNQFFDLRDGMLYSRRMEREKEKAAKARESVSHRKDRQKDNCNTERNTNRTTERTTQKAREPESQKEEGAKHSSPQSKTEINPSEASRLVQEQLGLSGQRMWVLATECVEKLVAAEKIAATTAAEEIVKRWQAYEAKPVNGGPHKMGKKGWLESGGYLCKPKAQPRPIDPIKKLMDEMGVTELPEYKPR